MNYSILLLAIVLLTDTCGDYYSRTIRNNTPYGVLIINYENQSVNRSDTFTYIEPYSKFQSSEPDLGPYGFFNTTPYTPEQTDSLVINFYQEGSDTIFHRVFKQYDTTLLFRCLTGSEPPTCIIEEWHLEGAELIVK